MEQPEPSAAFYDELLKNSEVVLCVLDQEKNITYVCKAAERLLGYRQVDLIGKRANDFLHEDDVQTVKQLPVFCGTSIKTHLPYCRIKYKGGNWVWMEINIADARHHEHIKGYAVTLKNATALKEAQRNVETDQAYYNSLFRSYPGLVFTLSPQGIFEKVNSKVTELLGYTGQELIGKQFTKFAAASFDDEALKKLSKYRNNKPYIVEEDVVTKGGQVKTLRFTMIPVFMNNEKVGILGIARDISAEKTAQKELRKLSLVASKAVSCVLLTDASGIIEWVNDEFTHVTGYTLEEAVGITPGRLLQGPGTDPATIRFMHDKIQAREPFYVEVINYRKNGEKFWFNMDIIPLFDDAGNLTQFFAIQNDINERKKTETKMRLLTEDLIRHNKELQQFIYIVSHNLRAPVANILGLTSILENYADNPDIFYRTIHNLKQTSQSLDNVIKDLNEILSLRDAGADVRREKVYIHTICMEVVNSLQSKLESVAAKVEIAVPGRVCIRANRAYVYSIFHNLISNAIKYRDGIRPLHIKISSSSTDGMHEIRVEDNGIGMDLEKVGSQLFKLYGKIDLEAEGKGIGLYMVKTQVESLNGTIDVESIPGKGTTFILQFKKDTTRLKSPPKV